MATNHLYSPKACLLQTDVNQSQPSPTQDIWYTVLDTTANVRLVFVAVSIATTAETLEIRLTIDGVVLTASQAAIIATPYYFRKVYSGATFSSAIVNTATNTCLEGRSVKVEMRKTTAEGTGTMSGYVVYETF